MTILCYFEVVAVNVSSLIITHRSQHTLLCTNDPRSSHLSAACISSAIIYAYTETLIVTCAALLCAHGDGLYTITQLLNTRRCSAIS